MRRPAPRPLGQTLAELTAQLAPQTVLAEVQGSWSRTVGRAVAAAATPTGERDGVLTVTCSAAVWAQELELMGPQLVDRLNAALGRPALRGLRCRTGARGGAN